MTSGQMETDIDYSIEPKNRLTISLERDKMDYYDFKLLDNLTGNGIICKVKRGTGFIGSCKPIGDVEIES
jgi:hypothetical protein